MIGPRGEGGPPLEAMSGQSEQKKEDPPVAERRGDDPPAVPAGELQIDFVRSSGPGGQNVNKTSTKAQLRWKVGASSAFSEEEKMKIREYAGKRLNNDDEIVVAADTERSQLQNRGE